ncbi:CRISPR system precrRNA processing endoribonuclease RAMP protein Cas6 [Nostoc sp. WHI]|uniref:CRISPR system precrRNA processing endoribonuclease RAMP protein Cas6 n=1 Tax=Nostoc sp. WHI TaxID=2650611 RepID=UPI0018C607D1|nr:CRISPR system precrRNA processing endoribonuclease RAMP protein Cas6 [Nostoc sp. WHI]MBG1266377.1 CRISPR system precrRNA processing endoribonuclease RAMP protein Cas6 [Nostoc sp. WHI]
MISTKDTEITFAGLSVVLKQVETSISPTPLNSWLSETQLLPVWIPLRINAGVTKIMPVLPNSVLYPNLMQSICQQIAQNTLVEWWQKPYELTGVEVDSHALHMIQISVASAAPPPTLGRAIHAQCFRWFANADTALAENLHQQNTLPLTVAVQYVSPQKMQLRITLLKKELLAPLLWGLSTNLGESIMLAGIPCQLGKSIDILQASSFEKLVQTTTQSVIELRFLSPTSFKQNRGVQPFPLPELVFNSLLRRWNTFAPPELQFPEVEWNGLVSAYDLKTHALKMEGGAEIGAQGWVKYRFLDSDQARIATILAHFATFAGVGRKTAMGMGQVQKC